MDNNVEEPLEPNGEHSNYNEVLTSFKNKENIIKSVHRLREQISFLTYLLNKLRTISKNTVEYEKEDSNFKIKEVVTFTKEILSVKENLTLCKGWLKIVLEDLEGYKEFNDNIEDKEDIERDSDCVKCMFDEEVYIGLSNQSSMSVKRFTELNNLSRICKLKSYVKILVEDFKKLTELNYITIEPATVIYTLLQSTRIMLDEELQRIKVSNSYVCQ
jgi:DNA-dependent RNA polymerase auxiliary subunit epsilon